MIDNKVDMFKNKKLMQGTNTNKKIKIQEFYGQKYKILILINKN
jgi:hypothetical protein